MSEVFHFSISRTSRPEANASGVLIHLLRHHRVRVSTAAAQDLITSHPDYPSLLSVHETLKALRVDSSAFELNSTDQLRDLPLPFVAHRLDREGWFALVTALHETSLTWYDTDYGYRTESLHNFAHAWSGAVLLAEADVHSGEFTYHESRKKERLQSARSGLLIVGSIMLLALGLHKVALYANSVVWSLVLTKTFGAFLSLVLLTAQFNRQNQWLARLCKVTEKTDCQSVLDSSAAKLWGWLSWAEVGSFYFLGGFLTLFLSTTSACLSFFALLGTLAAPYALFSVYYQWKVIKSWCVLCLAIQALLIVEFLLTLPYLSASILPTLFQVLPHGLVGFNLPVLSYVFIKPWIAKLNHIPFTERQLRLFKNDATLFEFIARRQPAFITNPPLSGILLGNPNASHTLTMVTNPYCGPCARVHEELIQLITQNQHINARLIFWAYDGPNGRIYTASRHLLAWSRHNPRQVMEALDAWYAQNTKIYSNWAAQFPVADLSASDSDVNEHRLWCTQNMIKATPTLYMDGFLLPELYQLPDLKWYA